MKQQMKQRILSVILMLTMLVVLLPVGLPTAQAYSETDIAYPVEGGNIYFDKETGTITDCDFSVTKVDIPTEIEGVPVTSIGYEAFYYCESLVSVAIPDGVTSIGAYAFWECSSLEKMIIPNSVTDIRNGAFAKCTSLISVVIGSGVESIAFSVFNGCDSLLTINVDSENLFYSSDNYGILFDKTRTNLIYCPNGFSGEYEIPKSVERICSGAFEHCSRLTEVTIPESVGIIGEDAFKSCTSLTEVLIPNSVTLIQNEAFRDCKALTSVKLSASIIEIGMLSFYGCTALKEVLIPASVERIEPSAFGACDSMTKIVVDADNQYYCSDEQGILFNKDKTLLLQCPCAFEGKYIVPNGVQKICGSAFEDCILLTDITLPSSLTEISYWAFGECDALTYVIIPEDVDSIDSDAFYDCKSLKGVYFIGNAPQIGDSVFQIYCSDTNSPEYNPNLTLYYVEGKEGWTNPKWNGYPTATWDGVNIPHIHSYQAVVTAPTCTEQGYTTHICKCGDSYIDTFVDAIGHQYENGVCVRCGENDPNMQPSVEFVDVPQNEWYVGAVDYAVRNGLMGGTSANTFEPESAMTRAMLVTVLWRYEGKPMGYQNTFSDVNAKDGSWYIDAVAWAAANGIVGGVGNNKFDPDGNITREQMATILYRYAKKKGIDTGKRGDLSGFPDGGKVESWAKDAVQWTVAEKIIGGSEGYLLPQGNATRAQVATILMRFIENIVKK